MGQKFFITITLVKYFRLKTETSDKDIGKQFKLDQTDNSSFGRLLRIIDLIFVQNGKSEYIGVQ
jgi:hypothetical protein